MADQDRTPPKPLDAFRAAFWKDAEAGAVRSLNEYLARFPGDAERIAREYLALKDGAKPDPSPDRVAHYRKIRQIGRGGQGTVYLAEDTHLHRQVALKVMDPGFASDAIAVERFKREAEITSKLDHPGICTVYETGEDRGSRWIAMRYVEGESLAKKVSTAKEGLASGSTSTYVVLSAPGTRDEAPAASPPPRDTTGPKTWADISRLLLLFEDAARALHAAHEVGVIHRDIKPGNMMVAEDGKPVILDFGLAVDMGSDLPTLTMTGDLMGTKEYMSPEQIAAHRITLDRRTDVYSLGVSLFECLALRRPFEAPTREGLYEAIMTKAPPDLRRLNPALPADLRVVVATAIEKERDHRYQTALDLAEELRRVRMHEPIVAKPVGPLVKLQRWAQRNPALAATVAGLFAVLAIGLAVALFLLGQRDRALQDVTDERNAKQQALADYDALGDLSRLDSLGEEGDGLWPCDASRIPAMRAWVTRGAELEGRLPGHRDALRRLRESALPYAADDRARDLAAQAGTRDAVEQMRTFRNAEFRKVVIDHADALLKARRCTEARRRLGEIASRTDDVEVRSRIADSWRIEGRHDAAVPLYRACLAVAGDDLGSHIGLGISLLAMGSSEEAAAEFTKILRLRPSDLWARQQLDVALGLSPTPLQGGAQSHEVPGPSPDFREAYARVAEYDKTLARMEARTNERRTWRFVSSADQFKHDSMARLVAYLDDFVDPTTGLLADVRRRSAFALRVKRDTVEAHATAWANAIRSIADQGECPLYHGLKISPQVGLIPISRNSSTGLWEFLHLQTAAEDTPPLPALTPEGRIVVTEEMGLVLVLLPPGTFAMGAAPPRPDQAVTAPNADQSARPDEAPVTTVTLAPFFVSKYEMTQGQWYRLTGSKPSAYGAGGTYGGMTTDLRHPVENVTWDDCAMWLGRIGLALPTEAQWEYAARGGTTTPRWTGVAFDRLDGAANVATFLDHVGPTNYVVRTTDDGYVIHAPVGSLRANQFGLHDVLGNVLEWCRDRYSTYDTAPEAGEGFRDGNALYRTLRGASFTSDASEARSSARRSNTPENRFRDVGVRPMRRLDH